MAAEIEYLDPSTRVAKAWDDVRVLRLERQRVEQLLIEAEAKLDAERRREGNTDTVSFLAIPDAATRLGVSESMLWRAIRAGRLATTKIGRTTRVSDADLRAFVGQYGERTMTLTERARRLEQLADAIRRKARGSR